MPIDLDLQAIGPCDFSIIDETRDQPATNECDGAAHDTSHHNSPASSLRERDRIGHDLDTIASRPLLDDAKSSSPVIKPAVIFLGGQADNLRIVPKYDSGHGIERSSGQLVYVTNIPEGS